MVDEERGGPGDSGPVHYQISITGRQAAAFFLALLVALGLAFFFGMKTGAAARHGDASSVSASNDFSVSAPKATKEESPRASQATDDRKLGFAPVKPEPTEPPTKSEPPRPKPTERAEPSPEPTAVPRAATPTKPPEPTRAPKAEPTKPAPFFVQVLATKSPETADELAKKLKKAGFKADVSEIPNKAGYFRVRVGPYADKAKAQAAAKKIQAAEKSIKKPMVVP